MPRRAALAAAVLASLALAPAAGAAGDGLRAGSAVPPGQSGNTTLAGFAAGQAGGSYGPHIDDQHKL